MLNAMRNGTHSKIISFILFGLLLLATGGMVFMDVGGFFRNGGVSNNNVAKIGRDAITTQDFERDVQRIAAQQKTTPKLAYQFGLTDQILQQEINSRLLTQAAVQNGIIIGDDEVARQVGTLIEPAMKETKLSRHDVLRTMLRSQGMSEQDLIATIRQSMMTTVLQAALQSGATVIPRQEAVNFYRVQNESRTVEGFFLPNDSVKGIDDAKDEVLKAFYEAGKDAHYVIPETRSFTMAILSENNLKAATISDEDLQKEYDKTAATMNMPEQRIVQQAVVSKEEDAAKIVAAVKGGQSLKDAAQAVTGKATAYMGEQTYVKAGLTKDIADATFAAPVEQAIGPVKTALGYYVLVVKKIIAPDKKSFAAVKEDIRKELSQGKVAQQMLDTANAIDDRLAGGEDIGKIATEMGLKVEHLGPLGHEGQNAGKQDALKDYIKDRAYILKTAFEMNEGETAPIMQLADGRYAAIHLDKINVKAYRPFSDVREDLKKDWIADQRASANHERANRVQQAVAGNTKPLAAIAAENGASITNLSGLKRVGTPPKNIGKDGIAAIFDAGMGETVMAQVPDGYLIATVRVIAMPDPAKITDADLKPVIEALKQSAGQDAMLSYLHHLQDKTGVTINRRLLEQMYGTGENPG